MNDDRFTTLSEIQPADLSSCADGLFAPTTANAVGAILVTSEDDVRTAVYLEQPDGPTAIRLEGQMRGTMAGMLWPTPTIEVDVETAYDPRRRDRKAGDLLVSGGYVSIAAIGAGVFRDIELVPLWHNMDLPTEKVLGFSAWRLVSGSGDLRRTIFERKVETD